MANRSATPRGGSKKSRGKKTALWKDVRRSIAHSKGRFVSIMLLMLLGSFALVGLLVTGPDMRATGAQYFNEYDLADLTVMSDYGLDDNDEAALANISGTTAVEYGYFKDVTLDGSTNALRVMSLPESISTTEVVDGCLPEKTGEIAVDTNVCGDIAVGSTITVSEKAGALSDSTVLRETTYTVVGHIHTPEIISILNMGQSTAGTGTLKGYGVVVADEFDSDVYMTARMRFEDTADLDPYSNEYRDAVQAHKDEVEDALDGRPQQRLADVKADAQQTIDDGQAELDDAKAELADARATLDDAAQQIADAKQQIADSEDTLASAAAQLADGREQLNVSWAQLVSAKAQLDDAESTLSSGKAQLDDGKAQLNAGYAQLASAQSDYDAGVSALEAKRSDYESAKAQYETLQPQWEAQRSNWEQLDANRDAIAQGIAQCQAILDQDPDNEQAKAQLVQLQAQQAALDQLDQLKSGVEQLEAGISEFEANEAKLAAAKQQIDDSAALLAEKQATYDSGLKTYTVGLAQYRSGKASYYSGLESWKQAEETLAEKTGDYESGAAQIAEAKATLAEKEAEYEDGLNEYNDALPDAEQKIAVGEADLADARERLAKLSMPEYEADTRREALGSDAYKTYSTVSEIVDSLAYVFPVLLYVVAAFVTLSTMTRMVDEERINSGTLKALGYHDGDVALKFVLYGALAGGIGSILGIILGHTLMPYIAYSAYGAKFTLPPICLEFHPGIAVIAFALAMLCSALPAALSVHRELGEKPAALLLPKPPKSGSKIFLERIRPLWNRMSFTHKVTARNLFRYKQRMLMTVLGVAGAVCMLVAGFGVQHSIQQMSEDQFGSILKYDMISVQTSTATDDQVAEIDGLLDSDYVQNHEPLFYESVTLTAGDNGDTQEINLLVPEDESQLDEYLDLHERVSDEKLELDSTGAVISERLSQLLGVSVGDTVSFKAADGTERSVTVSGIAEMYMGHFMVMSREAYESCYATAFDANAALVKLKDSSLSNVEERACELMKLDGIKSVVQNTALKSQVDTVAVSLNKIMGVLIIVAGLLAVVIMYNLTNLNVSERMRELSTIKVLGFHSNETTMYIYRETILLTVIGVLVGFGLGVALHQYILNVVPPDNVMFNPELAAIQFVVPAIVIAIITVVLFFVELRRLSTVDMLEALKSVE